MLLTISLLCSGREQTTELCLKSIKKIRDSINSCEIIIIDTGCNHDLQNILQKYADQVIPFTWCNDFSAARNVGIDAASGEWFMFIDDDEWFTDPTPIINFFNSEQYVSYTNATYIVRNYSNFEGTIWNDSIASRLFKLGDKQTTRFHGKIFEVFHSIPGAEFHIDCHSEHYGFVFVSDEVRIKHSTRNIPLILEMMQDEPNEIKWPQHLVSEYYTLEEYTKLINLCHETLTIYQNISDYNTNIVRPAFYCGLLQALLCTCNYTQAIIEYNKAISDTRNSKMAMVRLCELGAIAAYNAGHDYAKVTEITNKFYSYIATYSNDDELDTPLFF